MNYVVNTGDGLEYYGKEELAKQAAQNALDYWRKIAIDVGEWPYEAASVSWAEIQQTAEGVWPHGGATCDYQLRPEQPEGQ